MSDSFKCFISICHQSVITQKSVMLLCAQQEAASDGASVSFAGCITPKRVHRYYKRKQKNLYMAHLSLIIYVLVIPIRVSDALSYARNNSECFLFSIRSDSAPSAEVFGGQGVRFRAFSGTKIVKVL